MSRWINLITGVTTMEEQEQTNETASPIEPVVMCNDERTMLLQALRFYAEQASYSSSWDCRNTFHVMEDKGLVARNAFLRLRELH